MSHYEDVIEYNAMIKRKFKALRRQVDELTMALEWIRNLAVVHLDHAEQEMSWHSFAERVKDKADAALARQEVME